MLVPRPETRCAGELATARRQFGGTADTVFLRQRPHASGQGGYAGILRVLASTDRTDEDWSDVAMTEKPPTGTVTLLMAAAEGSARLWQTQPGDMAASLPWLRASMNHLIALNDGVLRGGQYACDDFVATFGRASDAVSCALDLQLAPSDPFSLCIGLHTIEMRNGESIGSVTTDVAARLRDMAHGGQTLMSLATASLAADHLPVGASLIYIGDHDLGEMPWHERPFQLRHAGVYDQFRSLRATDDDTVAPHHLN